MKQFQAAQVIHCLPVIATWQMRGWSQGCGHSHVLYIVHYHGNRPLQANIKVIQVMIIA